jgi:hypothetical protein
LKITTYSKLVAAMEKIIASENNDRDGYVYEDLAVDMAKASALVYDGCLRSSQFTESNTSVRSSQSDGGTDGG